MIKIFTSEQFRAWDTTTIRQEPIASIDLMERACRAFTDWFTQNFTTHHKIAIVCGTGNNGGDGMGIARMLKEHGLFVKVFIHPGKKETLDYRINHQRLPANIPVTPLPEVIEPVLFEKCSIVIDALWGTGFRGSLDSRSHQLISVLNSLPVIRVAVDVPSGLITDESTPGLTFMADYTATFQSPKLAFVLPENESRVGQWTVLDIGLSQVYQNETITPYFIPTIKAIRKLIHPRKKFDHKGTFGHALIVSGSTGKMGAAVLSALACLRTGVGLLTVHTPGSGRVILQTAVPEAMVQSDKNPDTITSASVPPRVSAIGVGPGIGISPGTAAAVTELLKGGQPMVLDADALNILSDQKLLHLVPPDSILTPHPKEFERLAGTWKNEYERLIKLQTLAKQLQSVIILKGAWSSIANHSGEVYFNPTGNPGMATAGSGDVLTGILTALRAQGYSAQETALIGVYLHGLAGDMAVREKTAPGLIARDLIDFLPMGWKRLL
jgi:ADP-dependent NAD(P)H-hydrate dehydratase / NAD(P)H-hydrate epimerase